MGTGLAATRRRSIVTIILIALSCLVVVQVRTAPAAHADTSYSASAGFSGTQGGSGWTYESRPAGGGSRAQMGSWNGSAWRINSTTSEPWISATGMHPGTNDDAVRTWTAPSAGIVRITGTVAKADTSAGDGVIVNVLQNDTSVWSHSIAYNNSTGYTTDTPLSHVAVRANDTISFVVNKNGNYGADATNWNPTITYYGPYQASAGFSGTQGTNQWSYEYWAAGGGTPTAMSWDGNTWRGTANEPWISPTGAHPGASTDAVRKWVAPTDGVISITGRAYKADTSAGNGVNVSVLQHSAALNTDTTLWSNHINYNDSAGYTTDGDLGRVWVGAGDAIRFVVNNNGDYGADATTWDPTITYSITPTSWTASAGFSGGPQGTNQWRYQQRAIGTNTFTDMSWTSGAWRGGNGNWISVNNTHPDNSDDSVRTWVAPWSGIISITGNVYKINYTKADGLNGIVATVQKNSDSPLWSRPIVLDDWKGFYPDATLTTVGVTAGDQIHFIVNNNGDWGADETGWDPTVTYRGTAPTDTTYYVSSSGNDKNSGDSAHPWASISNLNSMHYFGAGVHILFHGGDSFAGGLAISIVGTSGDRASLESYGSGNAKLGDLAQPTTDIAALGDSEYVTIQNLNFIATPGTDFGTFDFVSVNHSTGLKIYSSRTSGNRWRSVYVHGVFFQYSRLGLWYDSHQASNVDGFDDVQVTNSEFDSTPLIGVIVYAYGAIDGGPVDQNTNVVIADNKFTHNYGDPQHPAEAQPIEVTGTTGVTIVRNLAADNCGFGGFNPIGGSTAIGVSNSRNFVIDYNEIHGTKSSTKYDGSAIDADQDAQNGEIAYNLTYNNAGPAVQIGSFGSGKTTSDIAIHHNMSYNDVRGNTSESIQGAIRFWGSTNRIQVFNNTVYVSSSGVLAGSVASAVSFERGMFDNNENLRFRNNIFKTTGGIPIIRPNGTVAGEYSATHISSNNEFVANLYDGSGSSPTVISTDNTTGTYTSITSLSAWRSAGQETSGGNPYGRMADAGLSSLSTPAGYLLSNPVSNFANFDLTAGSDARGQALSPWSILTETITVQTSDFHGNTATITDIGADTY